MNWWRMYDKDDESWKGVNFSVRVTSTLDPNVTCQGPLATKDRHASMEVACSPPFDAYVSGINDVPHLLRELMVDSSWCWMTTFYRAACKNRILNC